MNVSVSKEFLVGARDSESLSSAGHIHVKLIIGEIYQSRHMYLEFRSFITSDQFISPNILHIRVL